MASQYCSADESYELRRRVRTGDVAKVKSWLKDGKGDLLEAGKTERGWTPLHIACWGTAKPQSDKDMVEALLFFAQKAGKDKEDAVRNSRDKKEGLTPVDLAKQRRDALAGQKVSEDNSTAIEEKRKFEKIIEWLEKGLPSAA